MELRMAESWARSADLMLDGHQHEGWPEGSETPSSVARSYVSSASTVDMGDDRLSKAAAAMMWGSGAPKAITDRVAGGKRDFHLEVGSNIEAWIQEISGQFISTYCRTVSKSDSGKLQQPTTKASIK